MTAQYCWERARAHSKNYFIYSFFVCVLQYCIHEVEKNEMLRLFFQLITHYILTESNHYFSKAQFAWHVCLNTEIYGLSEACILFCIFKRDIAVVVAGDILSSKDSLLYNKEENPDLSRSRCNAQTIVAHCYGIQASWLVVAKETWCSLWKSWGVVSMGNEVAMIACSEVFSVLITH